MDLRDCSPAQTFLTRQFTLAPVTRIELRPWSSNTQSWVRSSELALSGFESELFAVAMRSMVRKPRSRCIGSANWPNSNYYIVSKGTSFAICVCSHGGTKVRLLG